MERHLNIEPDSDSQVHIGPDPISDRVSFAGIRLRSSVCCSSVSHARCRGGRKQTAGEKSNGIGVGSRFVSGSPRDFRRICLRPHAYFSFPRFVTPLSTPPANLAPNLYPPSQVSHPSCQWTNSSTDNQRSPGRFTRIFPSLDFAALVADFRQKLALRAIVPMEWWVFLNLDSSTTSV